MLSQEMEISTNLNLISNEESNTFLRALWAEFRQSFGKCAWQYSPRKDGENKRVYFGYVDIGIGSKSLSVSISYKQKGVIKEIFFKENFGEFSHENRRKILNSVDKAQENKNNLETYQFKSIVESDSLAIASYCGFHFKIDIADEVTNILLFEAKGFDEIDATTEAKRILVKILDFLSVCTNATFVIASLDVCVEDRFKSENEDVFNQDFDWIDSQPRIGNYLVLWEKQIKFIDNILQGKFDLNHPFIRASSHFHSASKLWLQSTIIDNRMEISNVLYVSALEVATELYPLKNSNCNECGQKKYSIRRQVKEITRLHLNDHIERFIDNYYSTRSKYLHAGILSSDTSYIGASIPQLDPSSASGCRSQISMSPINLSEFVGYILRSVFLTQIRELSSDDVEISL
jgi:hypothetical protein